MPSSLTEIRAALKTTVGQTGLQVYDTVPEVVNTPAVVVDPSPKNTVSFTGAMRMGGDEYHFDLVVMVSNTDPRNAQQILDQYVTGQGPKSLREFIFLNSDLGLGDVDAMVEAVIEYGGTMNVAGFEMIGAIMRVSVTVT